MVDPPNQNFTDAFDHVTPLLIQEGRDTMLISILVTFILSVFRSEGRGAWNFGTQRISARFSDYSTAPFIPYEMCAVSASKLCFEDYSKSPSVIRQLDCRFTPTNSSEVLIVPDETIYDMYFTTPGGHIVLVACGIKGFKAYDVKKKQLEWSGSGKLNGLENALDVSSVTSDSFSG